LDGLKLNPSLSNLKDVSFYFDCFNIQTKLPVKAIANCPLVYKGKEIAIKSGYSQEIDDRYKDISIDIETFLDINVRQKNW